MVGYGRGIVDVGPEGWGELEKREQGVFLGCGVWNLDGIR